MVCKEKREVPTYQTNTHYFTSPNKLISKDSCVLPHTPLKEWIVDFKTFVEIFDKPVRKWMPKVQMYKPTNTFSKPKRHFIESLLNVHVCPI